MKNRGMTLVEIIFAISIFTVVMGVIVTFSIGLGDTSRIQDIKVTGIDEGRRALQTLIHDIHQAAYTSVNFTELPGGILRYQVPEDLDGNGLPIDANVRLELSQPRIVSRDFEDINGDTKTDSQLIMVTATDVHELANELSSETEMPAADGTFGAEQDTNGNGRMDNGILFETWPGNGIRITIQTQGTTRQGHVLRTTLQEVVYPRN